MLNYIRLFRLPNLLMIPITMYLLRYGIIEPALDYGYSISLQTNMQLQFSDKLFLIVVLINVFLGAAGYVINDYFDRKIDSINRPDRVVVGKSIPRRTVIIIHFVLNAIAVVLAGYLSWKLRKPVILLVYLMISGIFWLYSTTYKKQLLIGNIIVAFLTALVPLQVAYYDIVPLNHAYAEVLLMNGADFKALLYWILAFALFAFIVNFAREIIKDIEDFEGDKNYECITVPISIGVKATKGVVITIFIGVIALLVNIYFKFIYDPFSQWYLLIALVIPLLVCVYLLISAKTVKNYHNISLILKLIMLMGVLYAIVAKYVMVFNFSI